MHASESFRYAFRLAVIAGMAGLAACGSTPKRSSGHSRDRECMARAMYFESNRSSDEGMLAVGTVVMNRVESGKFPTTVCGVVGQKKQFAPGVLSKPMTDSGRERAYRMADEVLRGKRHRGVGEKAMFFHTAGYNFRYNNMHYMALAGGNVFYEKRTATGGQRNRPQMEVVRYARAEKPSRPYREPEVASPRRPATRMADARPAPEPAIHRQAAPDPAWQPPQAPAPVLAAVPVAPSAVSIEDLILMESGF